MVETIMAVKDDSGYVVGEKKAIELVEQIGSLWAIIHLPPSEIVQVCSGIGLPTAQRLIEAVKKRQ